MCTRFDVGVDDDDDEEEEAIVGKDNEEDADRTLPIMDIVPDVKSEDGGEDIEDAKE